MNLIITKSINFNRLLFSLTKMPFKIEYLEPISNIFLKFLIFLIGKFTTSQFTRVKMGKFYFNKKEKLFKVSSRSATKLMRKHRLSIFKLSNSKFLNIISDIALRDIWYKNINNFLVNHYAEIRKKELKKSNIENLYILNKINNLSFGIINKFTIAFSIEIIRIIIKFLKFILLPLNKNKKQNIIINKVDSIFLASENYANNVNELTLRNQQIISENVSGNINYLVIDLIKDKYYNAYKIKDIYKGSIFEFCLLIEKLLPSISDYWHKKYVFNLLNLLSTLKTVFKIWSVCRLFKANNYYANGNSDDVAGLLIVSQLFNVPIYIFQYSLLYYMNPLVHTPYANILGFTKNHIKMYENESKNFNLIKTDSKRFNYPYSSLISKKRIENLKSKLEQNFQLSIAFFDENYFRDDSKIHANGCYFYDDYIKEVKFLLKIAYQNRNLALVFKSQFVQNTIFNLIERNNELRKFYNEDQIFNISVSNSHNDRNIVTPSEIAQSVDLSISCTMGGTAGYESLSVGCRTLFVNSRCSVYEDFFSKNLLLDNIEELRNILEGINYSRENLFKTNIGETNLFN